MKLALRTKQVVFLLSILYVLTLCEDQSCQWIKTTQITRGTITCYVNVHQGYIIRQRTIYFHTAFYLQGAKSHGVTPLDLTCSSLAVKTGNHYRTNL